MINNVSVNSRKVSVTKKFTFEACHNLLNYDGACSKLHGHSYKLYVTVSSYIHPNSEKIDECMVLDFKELKARVNKEIVDNLDHSYLNDFYVQPTAEVMVASMFNIISNIIPKDCTLERVRLYETEDSYAEVCRN